MDLILNKTDPSIKVRMIQYTYLASVNPSGNRGIKSIAAGGAYLYT
jgi:hypothetical protein